MVELNWGCYYQDTFCALCGARVRIPYVRDVPHVFKCAKCGVVTAYCITEEEEHLEEYIQVYLKKKKLEEKDGEHGVFGD